LNAALQTICEELPQEHINKAVSNFTNRVVKYLKYKYLKYVFEILGKYFVFCILAKFEMYFVLCI